MATGEPHATPLVKSRAYRSLRKCNACKYAYQRAPENRQNACISSYGTGFAVPISVAFVCKQPTLTGGAYDGKTVLTRNIESLGLAGLSGSFKRKYDCGLCRRRL